MKTPILLFSIICVLLTSGCSLFSTEKEDKTAEELKTEAMEAYNDKSYQTAIDTFKKLKDWYPFSKYAILAELKIPDAHFLLEEYEDAILGYENFETLHPRNEATPYVIYQIGQCYFKRIDNIDRDQTTARNALKTFKRLLKQFPQNKYAQKAQDHIKVCNTSLAEHEFYVGEFYYKAEHYTAALKRFEGLLADYPTMDPPLLKKTRHFIKACKDQINNPPENDTGILITLKRLLDF